MIQQIGISLILVYMISSCSPNGDVENAEIITQEDFEADIAESAADFSKESAEQENEFDQIELVDNRKTNAHIDSLLKIVELAIQKEDIELLLATMDTSIISSYGGGMRGYQDFRALWQEDNYKKLWVKLDKVLSLGGNFRNDSTYFAPYTGKVDEEVSKVNDMNVPYGCGITTHAKSKLYRTIDCKEDEAILVGRTYCMVVPQNNYWGAIDGLWKVNVLGTNHYGFIKSEDFYCSADFQ